MDQHQGGPAGHARTAHQGLLPPAAPVHRVLHPHPHRRGPVPHHQRHRRHGGRRDVDRDLHRRQLRHRDSHPRGHGRPVLAVGAPPTALHSPPPLPRPTPTPDAPTTPHPHTP